MPLNMLGKHFINYIRDLAFADDQKENYSNFAKELIVNYKNGLINKTRLLDSEKAYMSPFTPTFTKNDEKFKLAKFVV